MSGLAAIFAADILPILLIATVGYLLAQYAGAQVKTVSSVAFYALIPCLIFHLLVTSTVSGREVSQMMLAAVLVITAMAVVGLIAGRALKLSRSETSAFLLVVMFSNGGNYGLPLVSFAFGPVALAHATVFFVTGSVLTFTLGGFLAAAGRRSFRAAVIGVLNMPVIYGALAAVIVINTGVHVPDAIMRPITLLNNASLPTMILILGMQLQRATLPKRPGVAVAAVAVSLLVTPFIALALTHWLGITGPARQAAVILSSMPVAVSTTIMAIQYDIEPDLVTSTVFLSTILSPLTLAPLIAYLG